MLITICLKSMESHYSKYQRVECLKKLSAFEGLANCNFYNKAYKQKPWHLFLVQKWGKNWTR